MNDSSPGTRMKVVRRTSTWQHVASMTAMTDAKLHSKRFKIMEMDFSLSKKEETNMSTWKGENVK